jgi:hypothetical protein
MDNLHDHKDGAKQRNLTEVFDVIYFEKEYKWEICITRIIQGYFDEYMFNHNFMHVLHLPSQGNPLITQTSSLHVGHVYLSRAESGTTALPTPSATSRTVLIIFIFIILI